MSIEDLFSAASKTEEPKEEKEAKVVQRAGEIEQPESESVVTPTDEAAVEAEPVMDPQPEVEAEAPVVEAEVEVPVVETTEVEAPAEETVETPESQEPSQEEVPAEAVEKVEESAEVVAEPPAEAAKETPTKEEVPPLKVGEEVVGKEKVDDLASLFSAPPPGEEAAAIAVPAAVKLPGAEVGFFDVQSEDLPRPPMPQMPTEWDTSDAEPMTQKVFTIFGDKGHSKTGVSLSFPGNIFAISMDRKTVQTWIEMYKKDPRIQIKDGIRYMDYSSPDATLKSADITLRYMNVLLDEVKERPVEEYPDWIFIDGLEQYIKICEWTMRWRNGLKYKQGVEIRIWADRRLYIKQLHIKALGLAKRGVIYTTYYKEEESIFGGVTTEKVKKPKWIDIIRDEADVLIFTEIKELPGQGRRFYATVETSKFNYIPTNKQVDITIPDGIVEHGETPIYDLIVDKEKMEERIDA